MVRSISTLKHMLTADIMCRLHCGPHDIRTIKLYLFAVEGCHEAIIPDMEASELEGDRSAFAQHLLHD